MSGDNGDTDLPGKKRKREIEKNFKKWPTKTQEDIPISKKQKKITNPAEDSEIDEDDEFLEEKVFRFKAAPEKAESRQHKSPRKEVKSIHDEDSKKEHHQQKEIRKNKRKQLVDDSRKSLPESLTNSLHELNRYAQTIPELVEEKLAEKYKQTWEDFWNKFWDVKNQLKGRTGYTDYSQIELQLEQYRSLLRDYIIEYVKYNNKHPFTFKLEKNDDKDDYYGHKVGEGANWLFAGTRSGEKWWFIKLDNELKREDAIILLLSHITLCWKEYEKFITDWHLRSVGILNKNIADLTESEKILCAAKMIEDGTWSEDEKRETDIIISAFLEQAQPDELEELSKKFLENLKLSNDENALKKNVVGKIPKALRKEQERRIQEQQSHARSAQIPAEVTTDLFKTTREKAEQLLKTMQEFASNLGEIDTLRDIYTRSNLHKIISDPSDFLLARIKKQAFVGSIVSLEQEKFKLEQEFDDLIQFLNTLVEKTEGFKRTKSEGRSLQSTKNTLAILQIEAQRLVELKREIVNQNNDGYKLTIENLTKQEESLRTKVAKVDRELTEQTNNKQRLQEQIEQQTKEFKYVKEDILETLQATGKRLSIPLELVLPIVVTQASEERETKKVPPIEKSVPLAAVENEIKIFAGQAEEFSNSLYGVNSTGSLLGKKVVAFDGVSDNAIVSSHITQTLETLKLTGLTSFVEEVKGTYLKQIQLARQNEQSNTRLQKIAEELKETIPTDKALESKIKEKQEEISNLSEYFLEEQNKLEDVQQAVVLLQENLMANSKQLGQVKELRKQLLTDDLSPRELGGIQQEESPSQEVPVIAKETRTFIQEDLYVKLTFSDIKEDKLSAWFLNYVDANCNSKNYKQDLEESLNLVNTVKLVELLQGIENNNSIPIIDQNHQFAIKLLALTVIKKLQEETLEELKLEGDYEEKLDILSDTIKDIGNIGARLTLILPEEESKVIKNLRKVQLEKIDDVDKKIIETKEDLHLLSLQQEKLIREESLHLELKELNLPACDFTHFKNKDGQAIGTILDNLSSIAFTLASETSEEEINSDDVDEKVLQQILDISEVFKIGKEENQTYVANIVEQIGNIEKTEKKKDGSLKYPGSQCKIAYDDWKENKIRYYQDLLSSIVPISENLNLGIAIPRLPKDFNSEESEDVINNFLEECESKVEKERDNLLKILNHLGSDIKVNLKGIGAGKNKLEIATEYNFEKILRMIVSSDLPGNSKLAWQDAQAMKDLFGKKEANLEDLITLIIKGLKKETPGEKYEDKKEKLKQICAALYDSDLSKTVGELNDPSYKAKPAHKKKSLADVFLDKYEKQKRLGGLAKNYEIIQEFKSSTLQQWRKSGIAGYEDHTEDLLGAIRKSEVIPGYHKTTLTPKEKLLQTDVSNMSKNEVRKLVFERDVGGKRYKHRSKFLIIKDDDGKIHIVNHYGGNRLYKPEDPLPKTKNMVTALLTLGIGHFGDVKAVFFPSGEQKALKIVREGSTQADIKSEWTRAKEGWDEEKNDLIREEMALKDTKQLIASAKIASFLRKITKRKKKLLTTEEEKVENKLTVPKKGEEIKSPREGLLSVRGTPRSSRNTSRGSLSSARSSGDTPRDPLLSARSPRGVATSSVIQPKSITHMAGIAHYMLMELSGSEDLRNESIKKWGQFVQLEEQKLEDKEPEEELIVEDESLSVPVDDDTNQDGITVPEEHTKEQIQLKPHSVQIKEQNLKEYCEFLLNRAVEVSDVLKIFHENGTHNDFKGANLAVNRDGKLELIDFGTYKKDKKEVAGQALNPIKHGTAMFISPSSLTTIREGLKNVSWQSLVSGFVKLPEPENRTDVTLKEYYIKRRLYDVLSSYKDTSISSVEDVGKLVRTIMHAGNASTLKTFEELQRNDKKRGFISKANLSNTLGTPHFSTAAYKFQTKAGSFGEYRPIKWTIEEEVKVILQEIQKVVNVNSNKFTMGCDASYDIYSLMATISGSANQDAYLNQLIYRYGKLNNQDLATLIKDPGKDKVCDIQEYAGEGQGLQLDRMFAILVESNQLGESKRQQFLQIKQKWEEFRDQILLQKLGYESLTMEKVSEEILKIKTAVMDIFTSPELQYVIKDDALLKVSETTLLLDSLEELQDSLFKSIEQRNLEKVKYLLHNNKILKDEQYLNLLILVVNKAVVTKNIEAFEELRKHYLALKREEPDFKKLVKDTLFDKIFPEVGLSMFEMSFYDHPKLLSFFMEKQEIFDFKLLFDRPLESPAPIEILLKGQNKSVWNVIKKELITSQSNKLIPEKLKFVTRLCYVGSPNNFASMIMSQFAGDNILIEKKLIDLSRLLANIIGSPKDQKNERARRLAKIILLASLPISNAALFEKFKNHLNLTAGEELTINAIRFVASKPEFNDTNIINELLTISNIEKFQEELMDVRLDLWYKDAEFTESRLTNEVVYKFFNEEVDKPKITALIAHQKNKLFKRFFDSLTFKELAELRPKIPELILIAEKNGNKQIAEYLRDKYKNDVELLRLLKSLPISERRLVDGHIKNLESQQENLTAILEFTIKECINDDLKREVQEQFSCLRAPINKLYKELIDIGANAIPNHPDRELCSELRKMLQKNPADIIEVSRKLLEQIQLKQNAKTFYDLLSSDPKRKSLNFKLKTARFFPQGMPDNKFILDYYGIEAINHLIENAEQISQEEFSKSLKEQFINELQVAKKSLDTAMAAANQLKTIIAEVTEIINAPPPTSDYNAFIQNQIKLCNDYPHAIQSIFNWHTNLTSAEK
ncbi:MAG: hypothetical protein ABSA84_00535 [Gammaproteobacteria bacterium]|jgi:hypothetical protein